MFAHQLRAAVEAAPRTGLVELSAALWKGFAAGALSEAEAEELSTLIEARRTVGQSPNLGFGPGASPKAKFSLRPQRPPVRSAAIERRRRLAASGPMPPALAARFTTAELAALKIISDDVRSSGACVLPIDAIAARAGVSRTSAQNAIRQACRLGMLERQERRRAYDRSLPSILRVIDREWSAWLRRGLKGGGLNSSSTTDRRVYREGGTRERQRDSGGTTPRRPRSQEREGRRAVGHGRDQR